MSALTFGQALTKYRADQARDNRGRFATEQGSQSQGSDKLADRMTRYRRHSGLRMGDFIRLVHDELKSGIPVKPIKSVLSSAPRYLSFARRHLNDRAIEDGFARVLAAHA